MEVRGDAPVGAGVDDAAADGGEGLFGDVALADLAGATPGVALHFFVAIVADA